MSAFAIAGLLLVTLQVWLTWRFRRDADRDDTRVFWRRPMVSILKPVCGLDDELEQNLVSFTQLRGVRYEVIISAEEWADPAIAIVRRVMREHPHAPFRIVIDPGSRSGVVNRKVERLIAAAEAARGEIFFISDSNVRVEPDDVARTIDAFANPRIGCVSNLFTASGAQSLGATIESLHLLSFVAPGAVLAASAGVPCVVGKSMAISRTVHDAIGGFARFRRVLAEDQAIGLAVRDAGFEVMLSPLTVRNVVVDRSVKKAVDRQVRWNKIRYSFSHGLYLSEILLNPFALALLALPFAPVVLLMRVLHVAVLNRALRAQLSWRQLLCVPLLDALMLYAWFVPFFSNSVTWRGYRARIGRNTEMIEVAA
ncbi:MAG TPA: glycosyltransferase [Thermoanaerobaculia bacterium]